MCYLRISCKTKTPVRKFFVITSLSCAALTVIVLVAWQNLPNPSRLRSEYPAVVFRPKKNAVQNFEVKWVKSRPAGWTALSEVSQKAVGAILVSEDWAFYQHQGLDWNQISEVLEDSWRLGHIKRGASTITQQVAKNVFLSQEKTVTRKLKEFLLATQLERAVGKKKVLETYLNIAEWGEGFFGIREAARVYFSKSPSELTAKEGAFLAMLLPNPKTYSSSFRQRELSSYARKTIESILVKMVQAGYLTPEQHQLELESLLSFELQSIPAENIEASPNVESSPAVDPGHETLPQSSG